MATSLTDQDAAENWDRYQYGLQRGHLAYMEQAALCEGMYLGGGEQWRSEDRKVLADAKRPAYEFNEVMPSINSAVGYQIHNRMDIAFRPRGGKADLATATILSKVVMQIADREMLHWKETQVATDGFVEQRGYFDIRMDFDNNIRGEIKYDFLDPMDVIPDPDAKTYDPDGWGDVIISRWLNLDEIEARYGKAARSKAEATKANDEDHGTSEDGQERSKFGSNGMPGLADAYLSTNSGLQRYRIVDRQYFVYERTPCLVFPDTGDVEIIENMTDEQVAQAQAGGAVQAMRMRRRVKWVVSTYYVTLFKAYSPYEHFTPVPFYAYFRRGKTRGMVDNAIGPQEALNKAVSQYVHIVNSAANSGWVIEQGSLSNMDAKDLENVGAMTGLVLEYKNGSAKPEKITPNQVPTGVDKLIDRASKALRDVTVPEAMRGGEAGRTVSGVAVQSEQFASQQQLAVPLDNLAFTRHLLAVRTIKLVQRYYDSHRVFRITETDPATGKEVENVLEINKFDPITGGYLNDVTLGTYDVVITEQPMQVTFQNSQFNQALEIKKAGVNLPDPVLIRYSNLADKHEILEQMQGANKVDPAVEAKAELVRAQAALALANATSKSVETQYSAVQTAQVIATMPAVSALADGLLHSAGYIDHDAAPIVPQLPAGAAGAMGVLPELPKNTNPLTPANPGVGLDAGIETAAPDGVRAEI